ncbi:MAG: recombinase family protein [Brevundimonas sp.]|uniref:recombinase family protein n=1 Tax=Brevundimonas sp. TaxID=1871086 RepID=UPI000DB09E5E|nr:recombinase family protein [Brevundimonas sp.]PZT97208.1 MAG: recombinase family protein [Brevundimonas sp.]
MLLAAQYLRMSTDHQRYSLGNQAALIAAFAEEHGYSVIRSYEDAGKSGVTTAGRTGLKALLRDVLGGAPFSTILVVDVSRWGRYQDPDEAAHYEFLCRDAGVRVRYCAEPFDDDGSPTAALVKNIKRVMAAEYSKQLSDRVRAALRRKMLAGSKAGGNPPYGFARQVLNADGSMGAVLGVGERRSRADQSVRIVHGTKEEVEVLRRIFRLFVRDFRGVTEIAHILNREGVPYRRSGPWNELRVRAVLKNELAIGIFAFNRTTSLFGNLESNPHAEWLRVQITEPLVPRALFAAAQHKLGTLRRRLQTDEDMIGRLRRLLEKDGHLCRSQIDESPLVQGSQAYIRRFGTLDAAMALAGYKRMKRYGEHVDRKGLKSDEIIKRLRKLLARTGYLNTPLINASPALPNASTIVNRFGTLTEAYRLVGYKHARSDIALAAWQRRKASGDKGRSSIDTSTMPTEDLAAGVSRT